MSPILLAWHLKPIMEENGVAVAIQNGVVSLEYSSKYKRAKNCKQKQISYENVTSKTVPHGHKINFLSPKISEIKLF